MQREHNGLQTHPTSRRGVKWSYILCRYCNHAFDRCISKWRVLSPLATCLYSPIAISHPNLIVPQQPMCTPLQHIWGLALKAPVPQHQVCMLDLALKLPLQQMHVWWLNSPQPEICIIQVMYLEVAVDELECYLHIFFYFIVHYIIVAADSALYSVLFSQHYFIQSTMIDMIARSVALAYLPLDIFYHCFRSFASNCCLLIWTFTS